MTLRNELEQLTPALRRIANALAARKLEAGDDLVHETMLRALKFENPAQGISVRAWVYALLIGINRQQARAHSLSAQNEASHAQSLRQSNEGRSLTPRRGGGLAKPVNDAVSCLQDLDLEEREAFLLVVLENMSYAQAALILGLPRATLIARLARARANLSARMDRTVTGTRHEAPTHLRLVK